jgi:outer membrane receptor protein involved in Fe transport
MNSLDLLPSANFTYNLSSKSNLRLSYYRTLARPEFRELAPFEYYDYELLAVQEGNPDLKRTLIDNADIRYELYPSAGQVLSVSVFYKNFTNAIESSITDYNSTPTISYFNSKHAEVYGAELELRKKLDFISPNSLFANTTFYTNLSLIKSKVKNQGNPLLIEQTRPLIGQSPYVINAGLQHSALESRLNFNLSYNRAGRRINKTGGQTFPSVWEAPRDLIDFQASYKVIKQKGEFKLNMSDLLNQKNVLYFDYNKDKKYSLPNDQTISRFKPGSNFSLSFSYSL